MKIAAINTGNLKLDGGAMFGVVPKVMWNKLYPADENNLINLSMRCLLVHTGKHVVLVDAGIGTKQGDKFLGHYYLNGSETLENSLKNEGYTPDDITDVILTHLHFDHCGGAVSWNADKTGYLPTFPNATYHVSKAQWELANYPNDREKASFLKENFIPLQEHDCLNLVENEEEIIPGISVRFFNGHTAGQMLPFIQFYDKTVIFMADVLALSAHIPLPYIMGYDMQPLLTLQEKKVFLAEAAAKGYILFYEHDLYTEASTVHETEKGVRLKDTLFIKDLNLS